LPAARHIPDVNEVVVGAGCEQPAVRAEGDAGGRGLQALVRANERTVLAAPGQDVRAHTHGDERLAVRAPGDVEHRAAPGRPGLEELTTGPEVDHRSPAAVLDRRHLRPFGP